MDIFQVTLIFIAFITIWVCIYALLLPWIKQIGVIYKPSRIHKVAFFTKEWPIREAKVLEKNDTSFLAELGPRLEPFGQVIRAALPIKYNDIYTNKTVFTWVFSRGTIKNGDVINIKVNPTEASEAFIVIDSDSE